MSDRLYLGTRKGVFTLRRSPTGRWSVWKVAFLADPASIVLSDARDGTLYAALDLGHFGVKLHRLRANARKWEEIAAPAFPEGADPAASSTAEPSAAAPSVSKVWALAAGGTDQPGWLWCGTIPGGLFLSKDGGKNWELVRSLWDHPQRKEWFGGGAIHPGIHSVCVDPRDSRRLAVGVSCGGVWRSRDAGASWELRGTGMRAAYMPPERAMDPVIQDPHMMVRCPAAPDVLWVQHHNGIFRSDNDCESWSEIKNVQPSSFGFAVAVHPKDADTAWFVPAQSDEKRVPVDGQVVVNRTRDGGRSFETLRKGLPQRHAYHLVYRHGLDVDPTGRQLAFGSTTGGLWISEDGGDSWKSPAPHLPPVYCVRFG
ncbi:MAG: exo-alpha-sialidase [Planctomycetota bacterium]|nr:MAG: exo-alpha-sialidase [Planctomycetota bacterium]